VSVTNLVFAVNHPESNLQGQKIIDWVRENILRKPKLLVGQNLVFDISRLLRASSAGAGAVRCLCDDSMVYHYMLNEHSPTRNLDYLVQTYTNLGRYKQEVDVTNLVNEDLKVVAKYNGTDAYAPRAVISSLRAELKEQGIYSQPAVELFRRLIPYVSCIEASGLALDRDRLLDVEAGLIETSLAASVELKAMAPGVLLTSPQQLSKFIFGDGGLGLKVPDIKDAYNEDGSVSTRKQVLDKLDHPFLDQLKIFKKAEKVLGYIRSTNGKSLIENLEDDGFVYPSYFLTKQERRGEKEGSVSRIAVKYPPLQNIPRESDVRTAGVSRYGSEGVLAEVDASQAELRIAAVQSEDPVLMEVFRSHEDIHAATAEFCGVPRDDPGGISGKNINFGLLYGSTISGLIEKFSLSYGKAKQIDEALKKKYAGVFAYMDSVRTEATQNGQVHTSYGMYRRVPGANPSTPKGRKLLLEAANYVIQRPASDIVQLLGWYMMNELDGIALPVMTSHDGLLWDVPKDNLPVFLDKMQQGVAYLPQLVKNVLQVDLKGVPFEFDIKVGDNWKEKKKVEFNVDCG